MDTFSILAFIVPHVVFSVIVFDVK